MLECRRVRRSVEPDRRGRYKEGLMKHHGLHHCETQARQLEVLKRAAAHSPNFYRQKH